MSDVATAAHAPSSPSPASARIAVPQLARGFLLGSADIVPGVSGGTVALVLGIYHALINALHHCVSTVVAFLRGDVTRGRHGLRTVPWLWLGSLGAGILTAVFLLSAPLKHLLAAYPLQAAGLFVGLILAAACLCARQVRRPTRGTAAIVAVSAVAFFALLGVSPAAGSGASPAPWWVFFLAGAVAICAMILPGVSGSFLLVLMGMYPQVIGAVADRDLVTLAVFGLGCATGLAVAAHALRWLLTHHHDLVLAAMIGLMLGSLRVLWPWPGGVESTAVALPAPGTALAPLLCAVAGFAVVIGVDALAARLRADA